MLQVACGRAQSPKPHSPGGLRTRASHSHASLLTSRVAAPSRIGRAPRTATTIFMASAAANPLHGHMATEGTTRQGAVPSSGWPPAKAPAAPLAQGSPPQPTAAGREGRAKPGPKKGSSNSWNSFRKEMAGKGLSLAEVRRLYLARQKGKKKAKRRQSKWNTFQKELSGRGLTHKQLSKLYRSTFGDSTQALLLLCANSHSSSAVTSEIVTVPASWRSSPSGSNGSPLAKAPSTFVQQPPHSRGHHHDLPLELFQHVLLPNLGYACLNMALREGTPSVFISRRATHASFLQRGLPYVSSLALSNCRDLLSILQWNEAAGIRFFRIPLDILPWCDKYNWEDLPDYDQIVQALAEAGAYAYRKGHRITSHAGHFVRLASPDQGRVKTSLRALELNSQLFDLLGLPASPASKINVHVGGAYGNKDASLSRFAAAASRLSPRCRARLTVENDDKRGGYSVKDLLPLSYSEGLPVVYDAHHHNLHNGGLEEECALKSAVNTWPEVLSLSLSLSLSLVLSAPLV
mmetsp:Transcript_21383/g.59346  ORF Transcript_21383/g.59346 Transcript_21383/m.59346 type:complete len:518 (+) Transcript_21383:948-2501(+)